MPATRFRIFVSSVQKELAEERRAVKSFVDGDPLVRRFFAAFLFEDLPATDRRADAVYLAEVDRCDVYLGILGSEYGYEDADGLSPTEREFERASEQRKHRLVFVKGRGDKGRHPKMLALIRKAGAQLVRRRFDDATELTTALGESLVEFLEARGAIQTAPFDERPCTDATLIDVDASAVAEFVTLARAKRGFPLPVSTPVERVLTHLRLLDGDRPKNAAILLFGRDPQGFFPSAELRCMRFHGTEIERPAPAHRTFKGTVFQQVDAAVDFVLSRLDLSVGTRAESTQAPTREEIPRDVITEAIVNAVAHRDYTLGGAVQVSVFADRVEAWNPGRLPESLTLESLRRPHSSVPRNERLCECLFLAGYIEKYGTGTLMMIRQSLARGLPEPAFEHRDGEFTITLGRDWLTPGVLAELDLNERQAKALPTIRVKRRVTNKEYREMSGASRPTAKRDLDDLVKKGVIVLRGRGRTARYELVAKRLANGSNGSSGGERKNGS